MFPHTHQPDISVFIPLFYLACLLSTAGFCHHGSLLILYLYSTCMLSRFSHNKLFANLRTAARQSLLSMGFSRQEYWSGWPCPPPGDLPDPGIEFASPALAGRFFTTNASWEAPPNSTHSSKKKLILGLANGALTRMMQAESWIQLAPWSLSSKHGYSLNLVIM